MDLDLEPAEARVLGSLLEKERTVPATYPLSMGALLTACNQSSSRDPVMTLSEADVERAVDGLKARGLVRKVLPSHGSRVVKYRHVAQEALALDDAQRAVLTVLLLRGPQTAMELRTRTERLHPFADADEVAATLTDMAGWGQPLVRLLPRRPGQRDARWAHLLSGDPELAAPAGRAAPAPPPAAVAPAAAPAAPPADPALHGPLAALVGTWVGGGEGRYPTIEPFGYVERIEVVPVPGKPLLAYRSTTRRPDGEGGDDAGPAGLHAESGFLRLVGGDEVELAVAAGPGIVEACSGVVEATAEGLELVLASDVVAGTPRAKEVTATERTYRVSGDELAYDLAMAAVGRPLTHHLSARLRRA